MGKFQLYGSKKLLSRGRKIIREMHILSSDECDSFLRSPIEVLKNFSWDKVMTEFSKAIITLLQFLIPNVADKKPFVCFLAL